MTLFDRWLDDAAIFPPGEAPMPAAVRAHLARAGSPRGRLVGPFVCSAARLSELAATLGASGPDLAVSVVADAAEVSDVVGRCTSAPRISLAAVELTAPAVVVVPEGVRVLAELPCEGVVRLPDGVAGKLRTGGLGPRAFPDSATLAAALAALVADARSFKLTAGLHRAVRHTDPATGLEHHGFLNVLLAVASLLADADRAEAERLLERRDGPALAAELRGRPPESWRAARAHFLSFGTCSVDEPIDDLVARGLIARERTPA